MSGNSMIFNQNVANYYFGGKLVGHSNSGSVSVISSDRLGSVGKYYPYGQEKPSATTNGTEKFAFYFRDSETGFDYADQRYHNPGTGRFLTPDPYRAMSTGSANPSVPGSWNKYAYAQGDPVNGIDSHGRKCAGTRMAIPATKTPATPTILRTHNTTAGADAADRSPHRHRRRHQVRRHASTLSSYTRAVFWAVQRWASWAHRTPISKSLDPARLWMRGQARMS